MATGEIIGSYETTLIYMNYSALYENSKLAPSLYLNVCLRRPIYNGRGEGDLENLPR